MKTNFHTHCNLDDGRGEMAEYIQAALKEGFTSLGFSCHAPLPFPNEWTLSDENLPVYLEKVDSYRKEYFGKLKIYKGLEIDFSPDLLFPPGRFEELNLDYIIRSVHMLKDPEDGKY